mmetsp:Transcript_125515/g.298081  ORF Transcript_125515/g.298081 Transcript_125515/m.298081 type:complete len:217 (+) Transcript_125515:282-932(+)
MMCRRSGARIPGGAVRLKLVGPRTGQVAERLIRGTTRDPPFSVLEGTDPRDSKEGLARNSRLRQLTLAVALGEALRTASQGAALGVAAPLAQSLGAASVAGDATRIPAAVARIPATVASGKAAAAAATFVAMSMAAAEDAPGHGVALVASLEASAFAGCPSSSFRRMFPKLTAAACSRSSGLVTASESSFISLLRSCASACSSSSFPLHALHAFSS